MGNTVVTVKNPEEEPLIDKYANPPDLEQQAHEKISSSFTCEICVESMETNNNMFINGEKCIHPFCTNCILRYIKLKVEEESSSTVECPGLGCNESIDPTTCKDMLEQTVFKWCDNLCESTLLQLDRCYCPNKDCSALIVNECGEIKSGYASKCPGCKNLLCFKCKTVWHAGYRCDEHELYNDANDVAFGAVLEANRWTRCPGCGQSIEHTEGCRTIRCRCGTSFCYDCGAKRKYLFHKCEKCSENNLRDEDDHKDLFGRYGLSPVVAIWILVLLCAGFVLYLYFSEGASGFFDGFEDSY